MELSGGKISVNEDGKVFTATYVEEGRKLVWDDGDVWNLSCDVPRKESV